MILETVCDLINNVERVRAYGRLQNSHKQTRCIQNPKRATHTSHGIVRECQLNDHCSVILLSLHVTEEGERKRKDKINARARQRTPREARRVLKRSWNDAEVSASWKCSLMVI